jgi:hypothetical protein
MNFMRLVERADQIFRERSSEPIMIRVSQNIMNAWKSSRFLAEMDGGVLVYSALGISLFLGCAGLAVDVSIWHAHSRQVQTITDAATLAYAQEFKRSKTDTDAEQQSRLHAANHGFDESDGDIIVFNKPPASGDFTSTADAIEVIIRRPVPVLLASLVFDENPRVTQRAVAAAYDPTDCIYALDPSAAGALSVTGTADVTLNCGARVNSDDPSALDQTGTSCITATSIDVNGGASGSCINPSPSTGVSPATDPFYGMQAPSSFPCDHNALVEVDTDTTVSPGVYCDGLTISGGTVDFSPGMYVIDGQGFVIAGNSVVTGDEVSFYLTDTAEGVTSGPPHSQHGPAYIAGTTDVTLSAPTSGYYEGVLFYQDPGADSSLVSALEGTSNMSLTGALYFPNTQVRYAGTTDVGGGGWTMIIARLVEFVGTSNVSSGNIDVSASSFLARPRLVE